MRELKSQIEDLVANLGTQKEKLSQQKLEHETEVFNGYQTWWLDIGVLIPLSTAITGLQADGFSIHNRQ